MNGETVKMVAVSIILLVIVLLLAFVVSRLVKKAIEKRRQMAEERARKMSETAEGRHELEGESEESSQRQSKALKALAIGYLIAYGLFIIVGIASIIIFIYQVKSGKRVWDVIASDRGFFVLGPIAMLWAVYSLLKVFVKRNK